MASNNNGDDQKRNSLPSEGDRTIFQQSSRIPTAAQHPPFQSTSAEMSAVQGLPVDGVAGGTLNTVINAHSRHGHRQTEQNEIMADKEKAGPRFHPNFTTWRPSAAKGETHYLNKSSKLLDLNVEIGADPRTDVNADIQNSNPGAHVPNVVNDRDRQNQIQYNSVDAALGRVATRPSHISPRHPHCTCGLRGRVLTMDTDNSGYHGIQPTIIGTSELSNMALKISESTLAGIHLVPQDEKPTQQQKNTRSPCNIAAKTIVAVVKEPRVEKLLRRNGEDISVSEYYRMVNGEHLGKQSNRRHDSTQVNSSRAPATGDRGSRNRDRQIWQTQPRYESVGTDFNRAPLRAHTTSRRPNCCCALTEGMLTMDIHDNEYHGVQPTIIDESDLNRIRSNIAAIKMPVEVKKPIEGTVLTANGDTISMIEYYRKKSSEYAKIYGAIRAQSMQLHSNAAQATDDNESLSDDGPYIQKSEKENKNAERKKTCRVEMMDLVDDNQGSGNAQDSDGDTSLACLLVEDENELKKSELLKIRKKKLLTISYSPVICPMDTCCRTIGMASLLSHFINDHINEVPLIEMYSGQPVKLQFHFEDFDFCKNKCLGILVYGGTEYNQGDQSSLPAERGICKPNAFLDKKYSHLTNHLPVLVVGCKTPLADVSEDKELEFVSTDTDNYEDFLMLVWVVSVSTTKPMNCTITAHGSNNHISRSIITFIRDLSEPQSPSEFLPYDPSVLRLDSSEIFNMMVKREDSVHLEIIITEYEQ